MFRTLRLLMAFPSSPCLDAVSVRRLSWESHSPIWSVCVCDRYLFFARSY